MTNLLHLPAEIITLIADYIKAANSSITPLAATTKQCQTHIEPINFRRLAVRTKELPDLSRAIAREGRFLALRHLAYHFDDIPVDTEDAGSFRISEMTRAAYSAAFTGAIRDLLGVLRENSDKAGASHPGISLELHSSPSAQKWTYLDAEGDEPDLRRAWLELTEDDLPAVPIVHTLRNDGPAEHLFEMIWPQSWAVLMSCFPNVKTLGMYAFDDERKALRSREEAREAFGLSLQKLPSTVTHVSLTYLSYPPANQFFDPPRLHDAKLGYDIFSHHLGLLSQRLVSLELHDASLSLTDFLSCSLWPSLESLDFRSLQPASPDGTWYFNIDTRIDAFDYEEDPQAHTLDDMREYMEEDELPAAMDVPLNPFRLSIDPSKFKAIYLTAAQAVKRMPKLRSLEINFDLQGDVGMGPGDHEFSYLHSRTEKWMRESEAEIKVGWGMVPAVEIEDEVLKAWAEVGEVKGASIELFLRNQNEDYYDYKPIAFNERSSDSDGLVA